MFVSLHLLIESFGGHAVELGQVGVQHHLLTPDEKDEALDSILGKLRVPVLSGLTFGHTDDQLTLPLGVVATLDADKGELVIEESGVL